jgi:hypothetical protein
MLIRAYPVLAPTLQEFHKLKKDHQPLRIYLPNLDFLSFIYFGSIGTGQRAGLYPGDKTAPGPGTYNIPGTNSAPKFV